MRFLYLETNLSVILFAISNLSPLICSVYSTSVKAFKIAVRILSFSKTTSLPSLLITLGGSFPAVLITITMSDLKKIVAVLMQAMKESAASKVDMIQQFSSLSKRARREGLLSLEDEISNLDDAFLKKGLQMVVDGIDPETIR